jgi:hypothetical protein
MKEHSLHTSPQLAHNEQHALALSPKQIHSLYKKSKYSNISLETLEEVYSRGYDAADEHKEQAGFNRVDSFIHGGEAATLDEDLNEKVKHLAKQVGGDILSTAFPHIAKIVKRHKKNSKYRRAYMREAVVQEPVSTDPAQPSSRFAGTDSGTAIYKNDTPGQRAETIKRVVLDKINKDKKDAT